MASMWKTTPSKPGKNGAWKPLVHAHAIGHKKIDIFPPCTTQRVRLNLISTTGRSHPRVSTLQRRHSLNQIIAYLTETMSDWLSNSLIYNLFRPRIPVELLAAPVRLRSHDRDN